MNVRALIDSWGVRSKPYFGQLVLLSLLLCGSALCAYFVFFRPDPDLHSKPAPGPATVLSWLPASTLHARALSYVFGLLYLAGALLWIGQLGLPWAGWLTAISYNVAVSLFLENATQATHVGHITGMMLLLYAMWYHTCNKEIRAAVAAGQFWTTPLYPRWVYSAGAFYIGLFYGLSGLSKLLQSGTGWANGVSLQLWAELFGHKNNIFTQLILRSRWLAALMQWTALIGETSGLLAAFWPLSRPVVGLLLIGFHVGQICVFGWGFHANMLLIALHFLPVSDVLAWIVKPCLRPDSSAPRRLTFARNALGKLREGVAKRLNLFGWTVFESDGSESELSPFGSNQQC